MLIVHLVAHGRLAETGERGLHVVGGDGSNLDDPVSSWISMIESHPDRPRPLTLFLWICVIPESPRHSGIKLASDTYTSLLKEVDPEIAEKAARRALTTAVRAASSYSADGASASISPVRCRSPASFGSLPHCGSTG
ncbi:hypothetical protein [Streptomyces sp. IB2014 016-6]|uniref:hypothetical protein n=1 Tax=Streptomyces sp. IB2014 016-6 TaxID=2517818 RepID=UPI0011CBEFFA|nr:hypothetical protein [Streptomyces sp. IB2014 016-6]TXL85559.1 hypothetical protein EW053_30500 [Streptomyces sp. IB2014 016-6]